MQICCLGSDETSSSLHDQVLGVCVYRIYSNKRRGAYLIFRATSAALIRGRRLFKHCTRQIYFFYIFIQRYTFYLLISQWTDTKLIVNLELRANSFVVVEQFTTFSQFRCHCLLLYQNLRAPAWEGKPLPHLNLCTRKDLHLVPSRYPIASEA